MGDVLNVSLLSYREPHVVGPYAFVPHQYLTYR